MNKNFQVISLGQRQSNFDKENSSSNSHPYIPLQYVKAYKVIYKVADKIWWCITIGKKILDNGWENFQTE